MIGATILDRTERYVRENFLYARPDFALDPAKSLIESGVVDSMGIMELIAFLEDEFAIAVAPEEITEQNLASLDAIVRFVMRKLPALQLA